METIEIIRIPDSQLVHGDISIKEIVNLGPNDEIERTSYDPETQEQIIRVIRRD